MNNIFPTLEEVELRDKHTREAVLFDNSRQHLVNEEYKTIKFVVKTIIILALAFALKLY